MTPSYENLDGDMSNMDKLSKAKQLLAQALGMASTALPNDTGMSEARGHIRQAIKKIENVVKEEVKRTQGRQYYHEKWWGDIMAHAPEAQMSHQAAARTLKELNSMISEEQKKLALLEQEVADKTKQQKILED